MIKISTIGTSWICEKFCEVINANKNFQLNTVYSRNLENAKEFSKKNKAQKFTDNYSTFLNDGTEAVYISSPNSLHFDQTKFFLTNKIHVICEKPLTTSKKELIILQKLAIKNKVVLMHAYKTIYLENFQKILLKYKKYIGNAKFALLQFGKTSSKWDNFINKGILENIFNPKMQSGSMNDLGIYCIMVSTYMFGDVDWKKPFLASAERHKNGIDLNSLFHYSHKNGTRITIQAAKNVDIKNYSEIVGENGSLLIKDISRLNEVIYVNKNGDKKVLSNKQHLNDMTNELKAFGNFINKKDDYKKCFKVDLESISLLEKFFSYK